MAVTAANLNPRPTGVLTGLRLNDGEPWDVFPDTRPADGHDIAIPTRIERDRNGHLLPVARLRRVGWLDQRGRVWTKIPDGATARSMRCGSFSPLLIDPGERDGT